MNDEKKTEKEEFTIKDENNDDDARLKAIKEKFFELIWSEDGVRYDLVMVEDAEYAVLDRLRMEERNLLKKDPTLNYMINSVCARHQADFEPYFPTPDDLRKFYRGDYAAGVMHLHGAIVRAALRLARQLGYTKRGFKKEMCDFLIGKGMMTAAEYASFLNLKDCAEEARLLLIIDAPSKDDVSNCMILYGRMMIELFTSQTSGKL